MIQADEALITPLPLPASPRAIAQSVGTWFVPVVYHPDAKRESNRFERLPRRAKPSASEALRHAERVIAFRGIRTNEAKRRLAAISDPWWVEMVASMRLKPMTVHQPVNRDRTGFQGWEC